MAVGRAFLCVRFVSGLMFRSRVFSVEMLEVAPFHSNRLIQLNVKNSMFIV